MSNPKVGRSGLATTLTAWRRFCAMHLAKFALGATGLGALAGCAGIAWQQDEALPFPAAWEEIGPGDIEIELLANGTGNVVNFPIVAEDAECSREYASLYSGPASWTSQDDGTVEVTLEQRAYRLVPGAAFMASDWRELYLELCPKSLGSMAVEFDSVYDSYLSPNSER